MIRISISLPDDLHEQVKRIADSSNVSIASTVRAILTDVVPRMSSVLDYLGTAPTVTPSDLDDADVWLRDLQALQERAPEAFRGAIRDLPTDLPPTLGRHD